MQLLKGKYVSFKYLSVCVCVQVLYNCICEKKVACVAPEEVACNLIYHLHWWRPVAKLHFG